MPGVAPSSSRPGTWLVSVAVALAALATLVAPAVGLAGERTWASDANRICLSWRARASNIDIREPRRSRDLYRLMRQARSIEAGLLRDLRGISSRPPEPARTALAEVRRDIREIDGTLAFYLAGRLAQFVRAVEVWADDDRPARAFRAAGASACAG